MKVQKLISRLCKIGCVICALLAFSALNRNESEIEDYLVADLPQDAFLIHSRIGFEFGTSAARYWKYAIYERNPRAVEMIFGPELNDENARSQIQKAQAANFYVAPDPKRDSIYLKRYDSIQKRAPDLRRRADFSERFKDMLKYIGSMAILGFIGFFLAKSQKTK